jgi:hypothetical protein
MTMCGPVKAVWLCDVTVWLSGVGILGVRITDEIAIAISNTKMISTMIFLLKCDALTG